MAEPPLRAAMAVHCFGLQQPRATSSFSVAGASPRWPHRDPSSRPPLLVRRCSRRVLPWLRLVAATEASRLPWSYLRPSPLLPRASSCSRQPPRARCICHAHHGHCSRCCYLLGHGHHRGCFKLRPWPRLLALGCLKLAIFLLSAMLSLYLSRELTLPPSLACFFSTISFQNTETNEPSRKLPHACIYKYLYIYILHIKPPYIS